jgi:hypothetical protein
MVKPNALFLTVSLNASPSLRHNLLEILRLKVEPMAGIGQFSPRLQIHNS